MSVHNPPHRIVLDPETRRRLLVDAAIEVFAAKGYRVASITDIIQQAGVARGTFYLYFQSKEQIFNAVLDRFHDLYQAMAAREMARNYGNPLELAASLRSALIEWLRFLLEHRQLTQIVFRQAAAVDPDYDQKYRQIQKATQAHWAEAIRFLQNIGLLRRDLDPQFLNTVFFGVTMQIILQAIAEKTEPDVEGIADQLLKLLRYGVLTPQLAAWSDTRASQ